MDNEAPGGFPSTRRPRGTSALRRLRQSSTEHSAWTGSSSGPQENPTAGAWSPCWRGFPPASPWRWSGTWTPSCLAGRVGTAGGGGCRSSPTGRSSSAGVRLGETLGSPIAMVIWNRDWENWQTAMCPLPPEPDENPKALRPITCPARARGPGGGAQVRPARRPGRAGAGQRPGDRGPGGVRRRGQAPPGRVRHPGGQPRGVASATWRPTVPDILPEDLNAAVDDDPVRCLDPEASEPDDAPPSTGQGARATPWAASSRWWPRACRWGSGATWPGTPSSTAASPRRLMSHPGGEGRGARVWASRARAGRDPEVHDPIVRRRSAHAAGRPGAVVEPGGRPGGRRHHRASRCSCGGP